MPLFSFNLDSFQITDTRSAHTDTDYASVTVKVGSNTPQTITSQNLGQPEQRDFRHWPELRRVGHLPGQPHRIQLSDRQLRIKHSRGRGLGPRRHWHTACQRSPTLNLPPFTSALSYVAGEYATVLNQIIRAGSCDGLVAAEQNTLQL